MGKSVTFFQWVGRILKWLVIVVVTVVVVAFVGVLVLNVANQHRAERAADEAHDEVVGETHAWRDELRAAVADDWGKPLASREEVICEIQRPQGGWFVMDHVHHCMVRVTDVYAGVDDPEQVQAQIDALDNGEELFGPKIENPGSTCIDLRRTYGDEPRRFQKALWLAPKGVDDDYMCKQSVLADHAEGSQLDEFRVRKSGDIPADVRAQRPLLIVQRTTDISSNSLGCAPLPMFCEKPWTAKIHMPGE